MATPAGVRVGPDVWVQVKVQALATQPTPPIAAPAAPKVTLLEFSPSDIQVEQSTNFTAQTSARAASVKLIVDNRSNQPALELAVTNAEGTRWALANRPISQVGTAANNYRRPVWAVATLADGSAGEVAGPFYLTVRPKVAGAPVVNPPQVVAVPPVAPPVPAPQVPVGVIPTLRAAQNVQAGMPWTALLTTNIEVYTAQSLAALGGRNCPIGPAQHISPSLSDANSAIFLIVIRAVTYDTRTSNALKS